MVSPRGLQRELTSSRAITEGIESAAQENNPNPLLDVVASIIEGVDVTKASGLGAVLKQLAKKETPPADLTTWLCARLRECRQRGRVRKPQQFDRRRRRSRRPVEVREYAEPVLPGLVMKCDEFANIHLLETERPHPEVWNFRKTDAELPVFGVGQCHLNGIAFVATHLKALGYDTVKWFNMREEPVVFLGGQACAPRTEGNMNENVEYLLSIEGHELDGMEKRLCEDCKAHAAEHQGTISVFYQEADGSNVAKDLATVTLGGPQTTLPMRGGYDWLATQEGAAAVEYYRVPIADETAPEEKDFDQLIGELRGCAAVDSCALVFNCQMGRGRTTTGMVSAYILCRAARRAPIEVEAKLDGAPRDRKRGEFASILELLGLIDKAQWPGAGVKAKKLADTACDACAHAQNMVEAIVACEDSAGKAEPGAARSPAFWRMRARNYLERYAYIILFAAYFSGAFLKYAQNRRAPFDAAAA